MPSRRPTREEKRATASEVYADAIASATTIRAAAYRAACEDNKARNKAAPGDRLQNHTACLEAFDRAEAAYYAAMVAAGTVCTASGGAR